MPDTEKNPKEPNIYKWALKFATVAGLTSMLCCIAPAILFMFGLMGGVYAISFADFFYGRNGVAGVGAWVLRIAAVAIGCYGVYSYRNRQNQCSVHPERKRKNLILLISIIFCFGISVFLSLEKWSSWYFDKYVVPAQQNELSERENIKI